MKTAVLASAFIIAALLSGCDNKQPPVKIEESGRADMEKAKAVSDSIQKQDDQTRKQIDDQAGANK